VVRHPAHGGRDGEKQGNNAHWLTVKRRRRGGGGRGRGSLLLMPLFIGERRGQKRSLGGCGTCARRELCRAHVHVLSSQAGLSVGSGGVRTRLVGKRLSASCLSRHCGVQRRRGSIIGRCSSRRRCAPPHNCDGMAQRMATATRW
jgi:hypothetical protein